MVTDEGPGVGEVMVTASGIARMANVGRAAVSNWRRRHSDFPLPVGGTPNSPLFDAREVERWLNQEGKLHHVGLEQRAWQHIESHRPAGHLADTLIIAGAYLLASSHKSADREDILLTPRRVLIVLRTLDRRLADTVNAILPKEWGQQLSTVLRAVDHLGKDRGSETAFEYLHSQYATSAHSLSGLASTPDSVVEVMLTLAGSGADTFDFTSGTGSILRMAADRALTAGTMTRCHAQEIHPQYALIALLRLMFIHQRALAAGHDLTPPTVHIGDSLLADAFADLRADIVMANFPFGIHDWGHQQLAYDSRWAYGLPPRTEAELAWVQHALAHLRTGGTAVVLMPPAAALRPAGRRIRAELVRRGALRAVVALPAGLMPPNGIGLHIWVLTQPDPHQPSDRLLFLDTTASTEGSLVDTVERAWRSYLSGHYAEAPGLQRAVPVIDILDEQVDLTPWRYLPQAGRITADTAQTLAKISDFNKLVGQVRTSLPAVTNGEADSLLKAPQASLADLIRSGSIVVQRATSRSGSLAKHALLTSTDVLAGRSATGTASAAPKEDAPPPRVEAGDILIPIIGRELVARVATPEQVGSELGPGVQLVRVDPTLFDPWFVAGFLSRTHNARVAGRTGSSGSGTFRIDVRRLTVPVLALDQQRAYGQAFRQLAAFHTSLNEAAAAGTALVREISDGLTWGTLVIQPDTNPGT